MKHNARRVAAVLSAATLALSISACGSDSDSGSASGSGGSAGDITIAGVYGLTVDPFWTSIGCGAKAKAEELGVTYKDFSTTSGDTAQFSQSFNSAAATNPSGMFVNPSNPDQLAAQYKQQMQKGVPIVTINGTSQPAQLKIVGTDVENLDFLEDLKALVPEGSGKLAVVNGIPGLPPVENRLNPVLDAVKEANPDLEELKPTYTQFDVNKATSAVNSLLIANPDLKVIIAADGPDGMAAAAAVDAAKKSGEVTIFALDAIPPEVEALKSGTITALIAQAPSQIGAKQLETLVTYLEDNPDGGPVEATDDFEGVPQKMLTADNIDDPENADWVYKAEC
jgi:ribose transport system substrate-binding protein